MPSFPIRPYKSQTQYCCPSNCPHSDEQERSQPFSHDFPLLDPSSVLAACLCQLQAYFCGCKANSLCKMFHCTSAFRSRGQDRIASCRWRSNEDWVVRLICRSGRAGLFTGNSQLVFLRRTNKSPPVERNTNLIAVLSVKLAYLSPHRCCILVVQQITCNLLCVCVFPSDLRKSKAFLESRL